MVLAALLLISAESAARSISESADPAFRSVLVYPESRRYEAPVLHGIGSTESLVVSFDELADNVRHLRYELIHCDADWHTENLNPAELTEGFNEGVIDDAVHSRGTVSQYVNYRLMIPNDDVRPRISGNWIVRIYDEDAPFDTLLTVPFMISEDTADISGKTTGRTDRSYNDKEQQLEIAVDTHRADIRTPLTDLDIRVSQNSDTPRDIGMPLRFDAGHAVYAHNPALIFPAGNEFRRFETVSTDYPGLNVAHIDYIDPSYHFYLAADEPRTDKDYSYDSTQHGRFTIDAADTDNPDTESEYVWVHFTLAMPRLPHGNVELDGDLTRSLRPSQRRMNYNPAKRQYESSLLLKQGSYNYRYITTGDADRNMIDGNDHRTHNQYGIAVYYKAPADRYTRLLGYRTIEGGY